MYMQGGPPFPTRDCMLTVVDSNVDLFQVCKASGVPISDKQSRRGAERWTALIQTVAWLLREIVPLLQGQVVSLLTKQERDQVAIMVPITMPLGHPIVIVRSTHQFFLQMSRFYRMTHFRLYGCNCSLLYLTLGLEEWDWFDDSTKT